MEKQISENLQLKENAISESFNILRLERLLSFEKIANLLFTTEDEIKQILSNKDHEISYDLLFRMYFLAQVFIDNPYRENFTHSLANNLKEACIKEHQKRLNTASD